MTSVIDRIYLFNNMTAIYFIYTKFFQIGHIYFGIVAAQRSEYRLEKLGSSEPLHECR